MDITGKLRKGKNLIALKIDHSSISELALGGILKPIMVYAGPGVPEPAKPQKGENSQKGGEAKKAEKGEKAGKAGKGQTAERKKGGAK